MAADAAGGSRPRLGARLRPPPAALENISVEARRVVFFDLQASREQRRGAAGRQGQVMGPASVDGDRRQAERLAGLRGQGTVGIDRLVPAQGPRRSMMVLTSAGDPATGRPPCSTTPGPRPSGRSTCPGAVDVGQRRAARRAARPAHRQPVRPLPPQLAGGEDRLVASRTSPPPSPSTARRSPGPACATAWDRPRAHPRRHRHRRGSRRDRTRCRQPADAAHRARPASPSRAVGSPGRVADVEATVLALWRSTTGHGCAPTRSRPPRWSSASGPKA